MTRTARSSVFYIGGDPLVADLDGDGDQDIAVSATITGVTYSYEIAVLSNNGSGEFALVGMFPTNDHGGRTTLTARDIDEDGDLDLITADVSILYSTCAADGTFDQPGGGTFGTAVRYPAGSGRDVLVADMNADGRLDLVTVSSVAEPGMISVLAGLEDGTFDRPYGIPAGDTPRAIDALHTNGDDVPEVLAVANHWPDTVTALTPNPHQAHAVNVWAHRFTENVNFGNRLIGAATISGTVFHDSDANDKFKSEPAENYAKMYGGRMYSRVKFYDVVEVFSSGENDLARLFDTNGNDTFEGQRDVSWLRTDVFDVGVHNFRHVIAYSNQGGFDEATLKDSVLGDELHLKKHKSEIFGLSTKCARILARSLARASTTWRLWQSISSDP